MDQQSKDLWNNWKQDLDELTQEVYELNRGNEYFRDSLAMLQVERIALTSVHNWVFGMYAKDATLALRRIVDTRKDCVSLHRVLHAIQRKPSVLSRANLVAFYCRDHAHELDHFEPMAHAYYDRYVGPGKADLDPDAVAADLERLRQACVLSGIQTTAHERLAHFSRDRKEPQVRWQGIHDAVITVIDLYVKYHRLLTCCDGLIFGTDPELARDLRDTWIRPVKEKT